MKLAGKRVEFGVVDGVKMLNANPANDLKTGVCYYVSISCDQRAVDEAKAIQLELGLPVDETQKFHLTIAGFAPAWIQCHPRSARAKSVDVHELTEAYRVLRRGDGLGFPGFNC